MIKNSKFEEAMFEISFFYRLRNHNEAIRLTNLYSKIFGNRRIRRRIWLKAIERDKSWNP